MSGINTALGRGAEAAPVVIRLVVGVIMLAHGWQKLTVMGPGAFGEGMLAGLGVPAPVLTGYVVTFVELVGGAALVVGLGTRLAALPIALVLAGATVLVKVDLGLIAPEGAPMPGAELDLALLAGLIVVALAGPGPFSVDRRLGLEDGVAPAGRSAAVA